MKLNKWKTPLIVVGWLVVIVLTILFFLSPGMRFFGSMIKEVVKERQRTVRLLLETDHKSLLEACRKLSREIDQGNQLPRNRYLVGYKPSPEVKRFPQVILDLDPMYVDIWTDGRVEVGMSGGIYHYGVRAYPESYKKSSNDFKFGDKKIIDGLWYYEDGYNPKRVEALLKKGKRKSEN